jgi:glycosyltransferase involved in cell wall biosynthesis
MKKNLAIITTHPIQYQVPLFKTLSKFKKINSYVLYGCNQGINKKKMDKDFNKRFFWNIPMLKGYKYFFSKKNSDYDSWFLRFINLSDKLKKINCNCILILGWNKLLYFQAILYAIQNKIPILLRAENNLKSEDSMLKKILKKIIFRFFFSLFKSIYYIGKLNKYFYLYYGVKKSKLYSTPYFVDNNFFYNKKIKKKSRDFNVLFVGKFIRRKRPFDIIKLAEILKYYKSINFTMVGDGPLLLECKKFVKKKFLNNISFTGFQNQRQMKSVYSKTDILINTSSYETWGLVVNEAMAAGLPCIVTDRTGCAADLIKKNKTGYIYRVGDLCSLKKYILKIYNNEKFYLRMSINANNIIKKNSIENTVKVISKSILAI